jgi:uncharacterized secreted protein with C-terminal beta-propeller domain
MKTKPVPIGPMTIFGALIMIVAVAAIAMLPYWDGEPFTPPPIPNPANEIPLVDLVGKPLPHFSSESEIIIQFKEAQLVSGGNYYARDMMTTGSFPSMNGAVAEADGGMGKSTSTSSPTPNYSTTNVQVEGVDEADIVKTDGEYIYAFYKNNVKIIKATPAENMEVVGTIALTDFYPQEMFVNGNQLILFGTKTEYLDEPYPIPYEKKIAAIPGMIRPYWGYSLSTVRVYTISDHTKPEQVKEYAFRGSYVSSRMIGDHVYFVVTTYPEYRLLQEGKESEDQSIIPPYYEDGVEKVLARPDEIGYIPPIFAQSFITVASIDLDSLNLKKETMVGSAETVYASENSLYLAHTQYYDPSDWPQIIADAATNIDILPRPQPYVQNQKTIIEKFSLNDGKIVFQGQGKVPGHVLNQFSMDEFDQHFRIATTTDPVWSGGWAIPLIATDGGVREVDKEDTQSKNNVYVLDVDMDTVGTLEDLAPGERIYSARFMGARAYLVTFKQVDPLFVIDLSDPSNPNVLGKLKIPGYSEYLHPIDETHIIGVGKDAAVGKNDVAYYLGMKLAIFDVSDVENPKQLHTLSVGDRGTDSYALQDHKAFLYDKEKELLVLPIYLYEIDENSKKEKPMGDWPEYGTPTYQGAFVYRVNLENGFDERARITHISEEVDLKSGYYYDYQYQVKRSLFIGDVLYTLSDKLVKANDLGQENVPEIKELEYVHIPKTFTIKSWVGGGLCINPCGYTEFEINSKKTKTTTFSGGEDGYTNSYENPVYSQYEDLVELLDWEAFKALDETQGCPGCTDGLTEKITISNGETTKTVKMEAGMKVEKLQNFLNTLRNYTGGYGYGGGYAIEGSVGDSDGVVTPTTVTPDTTSP